MDGLAAERTPRLVTMMSLASVARIHVRMLPPAPTPGKERDFKFRACKNGNLHLEFNGICWDS